jgi:hypothetical protein
LQGDLTEADIPVLKDRAFDACQDEAWDMYGLGVRFDVDETRYERFINVVEMDVRVGDRPMECTTYFGAARAGPPSNLMTEYYLSPYLLSYC